MPDKEATSSSPSLTTVDWGSALYADDDPKGSSPEAHAHAEAPSKPTAVVVDDAPMLDESDFDVVEAPPSETSQVPIIEVSPDEPEPARAPPPRIEPRTAVELMPSIPAPPILAPQVQPSRDAMELSEVMAAAELTPPMLDEDITPWGTPSITPAEASDTTEVPESLKRRASSAAIRAVQSAPAPRFPPSSVSLIDIAEMPPSSTSKISVFEPPASAVSMIDIAEMPPSSTSKISVFEPPASSVSMIDIAEMPPSSTSRISVVDEAPPTLVSPLRPSTSESEVPPSISDPGPLEAPSIPDLDPIGAPAPPASDPGPIEVTDLNEAFRGLSSSLPATEAEAHGAEAEETMVAFDSHPLDAFDGMFADRSPDEADTMDITGDRGPRPELEDGLVLSDVPPPLPSARPAPVVEAKTESVPIVSRSSVPSFPAQVAETVHYRERPPIELGAKTDAVIGIDLGTTYSCAAIVSGGEPRVLPARSGGLTIPSVVRYMPAGKTVVGVSAARSAEDYPERTIVGSKRLMGRQFSSPVVQEVQHHFAYAVVAGRDGEAAILVEDEIIGLEDVAATILQEIRESVGQQISVNRAVITCPAHFNERQREAIRTAGELAGFHVERVLNEPTAAALNYAVGRGLDRRRTLVYDLGGGTFDVSLLEVEGDTFEVLATGGDTFLGGLDFDACIVEVLAEAFVEQEHIDPREDPAAIAKLFTFAERAKRDLSYLDAATVRIDHLVVKPYAARALEVTLHRRRVEQMFEPLVAQTIEIVRDVIARAGLTLDLVDDIILVGGQSRAPIVGRAVATLFGRKPLDRIDPEQAVALGAARYAASLDQADSIVLIDALPLSIGVGLMGGRFMKLLERDSRLPAKRSYQIRTTRDDQREYELAIFQGESESVTDNEPLGMLYLEDLPRGPRGAVAIEVTLEVNAECILDVHAREMSTNRSVAARMITSGTSEELRLSLGLPAQPTHLELERRRAMVRDRPKGVWRWITGLFRKG